MAADAGSSPLQLPCVFSPKSRQYLALCAQDGRLRIWNTDSKTLHQEYVPSAHLSATCTCIAWGPCRTVKEGPQRKKRKSEAVQVEEKPDLLAMGTAAGTVLIYSTAKGALHCTLDGGHSGGVNCVQWHPEDSLLYSGSDDTNIIEWDLQTGKMRSKWKADRAAVTSLCVSHDGKLLLSAGQVIKMWDLDTKEVYRKFTGHSTAVTTLRFATTRPPDSNGLYFLSGAAHDRLLSVWQVRQDGKDKNSVVSFTLTDEPRHIDLVTSNSKEEAVRLSVVCKDGQLHLFEHFLNGPCKKPLSPLCSVQMSDTKDSPVPIPLLAAALGADTRNVLLAYGNHLQPVMERVEINTAERHVCLTRDVQTNLSISMETAVSKVKTPIVSTKSRVLVPGLPGHQAPVKGMSQGSEKRKKDTDTKEMSIAERLGEIDLIYGSTEKGAPKGTATLQTDNFAVLLVQGLESNDANILNKVFQTRKEVVIKKTVARLPLPAVLPLVEEITKRLQGHPFTAVLMVRWLKAVLMHHTSYLASLPDLVTQLGVLYHMIESRVKMFHKLTKLHGKLYLLMTQVATSDSSTTVTDVDHTAKLVYEEESSDEDEASGDEGLPDDDSDNWEEEEEVVEETMEEDDEEGEDPDSRTESKANGEEDMEHENESEEE
ncbi:LOW QUALITY PROTEIN: WD repeat-containing protein 43 [Lates calcarifer]|uniref:LOW QUALITY PROTEIN: WD repeat-containing protein 43 n=1 Tax=Lates calcarifer TaxID=8187 RepID=A0AAJ7Q9Y3_LATCA|nr:LOW QUALITY PROTEIN: WD repeat-containing protein 43 [Lates calcarifer]